MFVFITACSSTLSVSDRTDSDNGISVNSLAIVPNQLPAPESFKSIQLFANSTSTNPPILVLNSEDELTLSFDELTDVNGQFRITFSHHNKNWEYSDIPQDWYLQGIGELVMGGGQKSNSRGPDYIHYEIRISQEEVKFISSGNYLLHVSDTESGQELFSLPFFITENEGELSSTSQTIFNSGKRFFPEHRLFSSYHYPDFVKYPEFDLSFAYLQNRFWSDTRFTESFDFNTPDVAKFDLTQSNAFPANVGHIFKDLSVFTQNTYDIIEWNPGTVPPKVILREDVLNFLNSGSESKIRISKPESSTRSTYANVLFRLDADESLVPDDKIHILGDFNQWTVDDGSKLILNPDSGFWEHSQLLKEGSYSYHYAKINRNNHIDLTSLSDNSTPLVQEYMCLVYFNDPDRKFDRLLALETFYAR
ncbi:type IX secretion system plug protein domain-containing protein [Gracilimonas sp. Q87]|uniref:type IX secretion system plug protein n=1 Tax=Gracilimonas sp. Q87 TaxID=3384766 RepID=UPI0039841396